MNALGTRPLLPPPQDLHQKFVAHPFIQQMQPSLQGKVIEALQRVANDLSAQASSHQDKMTWKEIPYIGQRVKEIVKKNCELIPGLIVQQLPYLCAQVEICIFDILHKTPHSARIAAENLHKFPSEERLYQNLSALFLGQQEICGKIAKIFAHRTLSEGWIDHEIEQVLRHFWTVLKINGENEHQFKYGLSRTIRDCSGETNEAFSQETQLVKLLKNNQILQGRIAQYQCPEDTVASLYQALATSLIAPLILSDSNTLAREISVCVQEVVERYEEALFKEKNPIARTIFSEALEDVLWNYAGYNRADLIAGRGRKRFREEDEAAAKGPRPPQSPSAAR